jgi:hypothetical protein
MFALQYIVAGVRHTLLLNWHNQPDISLLHCKDSPMKLPGPLTSLILVLFGLMLWQMQQQDWGSFLLLLAAEAGLIAIRVTDQQKSSRL